MTAALVLAAGVGIIVLAAALLVFGSFSLAVLIAGICHACEQRRRCGAPLSLRGAAS